MKINELKSGTSEKGIPLPGVSIYVKGSTLGTATNPDEKFSKEGSNREVKLICPQLTGVGSFPGISPA